MVLSRWRTRLVPGPGNGRRSRLLTSWLREPGSLTARCQAACGHFRVRVLNQGLGRPLADEGDQFGISGQPSQAWVREVLLECDGRPVIYAHTVLPRQPRGRLSRWLAGLGSRSLGSLLFSHPGFSRGEIQFLPLDRRHPLFRRVSALLPEAGFGRLWARRSAHRLGNQTVLVTEVFLPAVTALARA